LLNSSLPFLCLSQCFTVRDRTKAVSFSSLNIIISKINLSMESFPIGFTDSRFAHG